jgi:DNA-binding GntR family transcriptional regulator
VIGEATADLPAAGSPSSGTDEFAEAILAAPLALPARRATTRGIAEFIGASQSRVARFWRQFPASSVASIELVPLLSMHQMVIEGVCVDDHGMHVLLRSADRQHRVPLAPISRLNVRRIRMVLAMEVLHADPTEKGPPSHNSSDEFWLAVNSVGGGTATGIVVTSGNIVHSPVDADRVRIVQTHGQQEWHGLVNPLALLAESLLDDDLKDLEQRILRRQDGSGAPFLWLRRAPVAASDSPVEQMLRDSPRTRSSMDSLAYEVLSGVQSGVADGSFGIGDQISERVLADRLGMGRGRVQRGIRALVDDGLIAVTEESGIAVRLPSTADVVEMYAARQALGSIIVRAASRRKEFPEEELTVLLDQLMQCARMDDAARAQQIDSAFQVAMAHGSGLSRIPAMLESFTKQLVMFITLIGVRYGFPPETIVEQNRSLLSAILAHDQDEAVRIWQLKMSEGLAYMLSTMSAGREISGRFRSTSSTG